MPRDRLRSAFWLSIVFLGGALFAMSVAAAEVSPAKDAESGFDVYTLKVGKTVAKLVPAAGCNLYSIEFDGVELLRKPKSLKELPGFAYGNPVLYPTPNRIRGAVMQWDGATYTFPDNNNGNFLHGLVHSIEWRVDKVTTDATTASILCSVEFKPGTTRYDLFPFAHTLHLKTTVRDGSARFEYTVENTGDKPLPFGVAFHPWFLNHGSREDIYLTVPATHIFESVDLLPTGKLIPLDGSPFDCRKPRKLQGFVVDDVWHGLTPGEPAVIDYRAAKLKISLPATADFKNLVVYTHQPDTFCVENQTCSTDAHNLHTKGLVKEASLQVVPPKGKTSGAAEFQFEKY
jgi:aldose 1-epimerase